MSEIHISFLAHSGFAVETATKVLVFDYYKDDKKIVDSYAKGSKPLWFFISHWHEDHFNRDIAKFEAHTRHYIYNKDVRFHCQDTKKMQSMRLYDTIHMEDAIITQYGSTDEGGSFLVQTDGLKIFHAGDLNWWHWLGDTDANNAFAKDNFQREMKKIAGQQVDIAFFPVDARLEAAREWGVTGFLQDVTVTKCLIPMHYFGTPWTPSDKFKAAYGNVPVWIPIHEGDAVNIK